MALEEKYYVDFELRSETIAPDEITSKTGLQPVSTQVKGKPIRKKNTGVVLRYAENNRWVIRSSLPAGTEVEDQFKQLLDTLRPHKEYLANLAQNSECMWPIWGHSYNASGQIGLNLRSEILKELSDYNSEIDIDIYLRRKEWDKKL